MIKVNRNSVERPDVLEIRVGGKESLAMKEIKKAQDSLDKWIADGKDQTKWSFTFKVYKHDKVKKALTDLFHGKCAYCETRYAALQPMDVEHWRPKGQVIKADGSAQKPAYYWLAAEWTNLLPSCIDCNRERKQINALSGKEMSAGKKDHFPVEDESKRAAKSDEIKNEKPLLLNPCTDDPDKVIRFDTEEAAVLPVTKTGFKRKMADASIRVYGLNRSELVLNRKEHLRIIQLHITLINSLSALLRDVPDLPANVVTVIEELIFEVMKELVDARKPHRPYCMLTRQAIKTGLADFVELD